MFAKWPKQDLRPDYQFQDVLGKVVDARFQNYKPSMEPEEIMKARALQFLVQDKFMNRVCCSGDNVVECAVSLTTLLV